MVAAWRWYVATSELARCCCGAGQCVAGGGGHVLSDFKLVKMFLCLRLLRAIIRPQQICVFQSLAADRLLALENLQAVVEALLRLVRLCRRLFEELFEPGEPLLEPLRSCELSDLGLKLRIVVLLAGQEGGEEAPGSRAALWAAHDTHVGGPEHETAALETRRWRTDRSNPEAQPKRRRGGGGDGPNFKSRHQQGAMVCKQRTARKLCSFSHRHIKGR